MREGWEIKKLSEVATFYNGYTPKADDLLEYGSIPYFKVSDMNHPRNTKYLIHSLLFLKKGGKIYPKDTIVFPKNGAAIATNKKRILAQDSVVDLNTGGIYPKDNIIECEFLYLFLLNVDFRFLTRRGAVPTLDIAELKNLYIPIPSISEQKRIVAELDLLSEVIAKKREQLTQLDALAHSLFYTMFGDPITNEKGWKTKKFGDCYNLSSGQGLSAKSILGGEYPVYGGNGIVGYHCNYNLDGENIIIGRVGALCGNVRNLIGKVFITDNAFILTKKIENINIFLLYLLRLHNLRKYAREAMQPVISNLGLKNILIILPPLALQQQFAEKIKAIEQQKERIRQSLSEVQLLFNSRMDYYFG